MARKMCISTDMSHTICDTHEINTSGNGIRTHNVGCDKHGLHR